MISTGCRNWYFFRLVPVLLSILTGTGCSPFLSGTAREFFIRRHDRFSVTVYPVRVFLGKDYTHEPIFSKALPELLEAEGIAETTVSDVPASFPIIWKKNQRSQFLLHGKSYASFIRHQSLTTDYALFAEIYCNRNETRLVAVHYYLIDQDGRLAEGRFINPHHPEFLALQPVNRQGGFDLLTRMIRKHLKPNSDDSLLH